MRVRARAKNGGRGMGIRGNNNISHQPHDSEKLMCSHTNAASHQYSVAMLIEKRSMHQSNQECCV